MSTEFHFDGLNDPVQPRKHGEIKIQAGWDKLARDSVAAQNAGMTYGQYMASCRQAAQPVAEEAVDNRRTCRWCGKKFAHSAHYRKYCSDECKRAHEIVRKRRERKRRELKRRERKSGIGV